MVATTNSPRSTEGIIVANASIHFAEHIPRTKLDSQQPRKKNQEYAITVLEKSKTGNGSGRVGGCGASEEEAICCGCTNRQPALGLYKIPCDAARVTDPM
jgi:hypothetical protein